MKSGIIKISLPLVATTLVVVFTALNLRLPAFASQGSNVTICHRTNSATNPYTVITVDESAVDGQAGNSGNEADHFGEHQGPLASSEAVADALKTAKIEWGDIIPPVAPYHLGLNWTAQGQAIYNNGCNYVTASPTPSVTPTPTPSASPSPSATPTPTPSPTPCVCQSPTPSPSVSPSPTPSATPSASPSPTPSTGGGSPTPTPTPTSTPTPTPTPTPSSGGGDGGGGGSTSGGGQVQGASTGPTTLASTGAADLQLMTLGFAMITSGWVLGKSKLSRKAK